MIRAHRDVAPSGPRGTSSRQTAAGQGDGVATLLVDRLEKLDPQLPAGEAGIEQIKVD
jgi:hypothetical protein